MENENVYQPPESELYVEPPLPSDGLSYAGPSARSVSDGISWISSGFAFFKADPMQWIVTLVVGFVIMLVIQIVPIVGMIVGMLTTYVWIGGLMIGCHAVRQGKPFNIEYLFAAFKTHLGALVGLSAIYLVLTVLIMGIAVGAVYYDIMIGTAEPEQIFNATIMLKILVAMAFLIPVLMAIWFAPVLIVLQDMSVIEAMKASFVGCLKNTLPFLLYGVVCLVLYILAMIPLLLGLLVLVPTLIGSMYASYEDIYLSKNDEDSSH